MFVPKVNIVHQNTEHCISSLERIHNAYHTLWSLCSPRPHFYRPVFFLANVLKCYHPSSLYTVSTNPNQSEHSQLKKDDKSAPIREQPSFANTNTLHPTNKLWKQPGSYNTVRPGDRPIVSGPHSCMGGNPRAYITWTGGAYPGPSSCPWNWELAIEQTKKARPNKQREVANFHSHFGSSRLPF